MKTTKIYLLRGLSAMQYQRMREAQMQAALVWTTCMHLHQQARMAHTPWPEQDELQKATKGRRFALHSQSIQMVTHAFLANIKTTQQLRQTHPQMKMRYPYKEKHFYPVSWPRQAVHKEPGRTLLPMGLGRRPLIVPFELPENSDSVTLVWNHGYELHVCLEIPQVEQAPGNAHATVDLGEIHLASVTTNTGAALIVTGRGIRSLKRQRSKSLRRIAKKQSRCTKQSRRWQKLQRAKDKQCRRAERRIRDQRHQATRKVITFCIEQQVGTLFIGNPDGVRKRRSGRHHNQRMSLWEYGTDIQYLTHKSAHRVLHWFGTRNQQPVSRVRA